MSIDDIKVRLLRAVRVLHPGEKAKLEDANKRGMRQDEPIEPDFNAVDEGPFKFGKPFSYDQHTLIEYLRVHPILSAIRSKKVDKIMAGGYRVEYDEDDPEAVKQYEKFIAWEPFAGGRVENLQEQMNFNMVLRRQADSIVSSDNVYTFVWDNLANAGVVDGGDVQLVVLDWEFMRPNRNDASGRFNPERSYVQWNRDNKPVGYFSLAKTAHAVYYGEGTKIEGRSLFLATLHAASRKLWADKYASATFVNQRPKYLWKITGSKLFFKRMVKMLIGSKEKPESDIYLRQEAGEKEAGMGVEGVPVSKAEDFPYEKYINESVDDMISGGLMPAGAIGYPNKSGGWAADGELSELDEHISGYRDFLERYNNEVIFPKPELGFTKLKVRLNKVNKRDELRDLKIAQLKRYFFSLNEIREGLGASLRDDVDADEIMGAGVGGENPFVDSDVNESDRVHELARGFPILKALMGDGKKSS